MKLLRQWLPLTRGQRRIVLAVLLSVALLMHFSCCDWQLSGKANRPLLGVSSGAGPAEFIGIAGRASSDPLVSTTFGIVLPLAALSLFMLLGVKWLRDQPMSSRLNSAQRRIVVASILVMALSLHLAVCQWSFMGEPGRGYSLFTVESSTQPRLYTGVFEKNGVSPILASVIGLALPIVLTASAAFLWLGWRRNDRVATGKCAACGYPMSSQLRPTCTECGAATRQPAAS